MTKNRRAAGNVFFPEVERAMEQPSRHMDKSVPVAAILLSIYIQGRV